MFQRISGALPLFQARASARTLGAEEVSERSAEMYLNLWEEGC
jgi:hypothetical protein